MVEVVAFEDIQDRRKLQERPVGHMYRTQFIDHRKEPGLGPHVFMIENSENRSLETHFHDVDQFQIVIGGNGSLGKHALAPYAVHFARAFTPYGPLVSGGGGGLVYMTVRARTDPVEKAQRLPQHRAKLEGMPNRKPCQVTGFAEFGAAPRGELRQVPGVGSEDGMAAYSLELGPGQEATPPKPAGGDGQCIVVLEGTLLHDGARKNGVTVIFAPPDAAACRIRAGEQGLKALVLNFPKPQSEAGGQAETEAREHGLYQCDLCAFSYSEREGYPEGGIAPGTPWDAVPKDWTCPDCSAGKEDFSKVDL